jgi:hypothetical protein
MIHQYLKLRTHNSSGLLLISIKLKCKEKFRMATNMLYYIYEYITLTEATYFSKNMQYEFNFISSRVRHVYH